MRGGIIFAKGKSSVALSITLAAFALPAASAFAATATWTGANGGNWTTGTNWSGGTGTGGVPGTADTAVINSGASDGPIISSAAGTVTNIYDGTTATGGIFSITAGGSITDTTGYLGVSANSIGTATVSGTGATWTNTGDLYVGNSYGGSGGDGLLTIGTGGTVTDANGRIANDAGSIGTVVISGAGATWTSGSSLYIGLSGDGQLTVGTGGKVNDANGYIGYAVGSIGTTVVSGTGATWANSSALIVGNSGNGLLTIGTGGMVSDANGYIGYAVGSIGTTVVSGTGATWMNSANLFIGSSGNGMLTIGTGGTVSASTGNIGLNAGSIGTAVVSGTGATWTNKGGLNVGNYGAGTLTVQNGGLVALDVGGSGDLNIGAYAGSIGTLNIAAGGQVTTTRNVAIGAYGDGILNISGGGVLDSGTTSIGNLAGSVGTATVTGPGATWITLQGFSIANSGAGTLTIANAGTVMAGGIVGVANQAGSTGILNIGSAPGSAAIAPGTLIANTVAFGSGTGTINFNHTSSAYAFTPSITGYGTINALAGNTFLAGDTSQFTGAINVTPGANLTTMAQQQGGVQTLVSNQQASVIESRALTNNLLGFTRPVDGSNYAYANAMFGSAEGMAGGQYSNRNVTLLGGIAYGQMDYPGITQGDATTIAAGLRYTLDDPFGDEGNALRPYAEIGGSTTLDEGLTFSRSYGLNVNQTATSSGSTSGSAWNEYGRLGLAWTIDQDDQLTGYGEYGQQNLQYSGYTESGGPFNANVAGGVMRMQVARLGGSYTVGLQDVLFAPFSVTLAGAAAHAVNAQSHMAASIDGVTIPTGNADPTWGEFGARVNVDLTDRTSASFGIDGTTGAQNLGTTVHGDVGLAYRF